MPRQSPPSEKNGEKNDDKSRLLLVGLGLDIIHRVLHRGDLLGILIGDLELEGLFDAVVTSAEAGAAKPDPAVFLLALARLGVPPAHAAHVGDSEADEEGARAAGLRFVPAPLADAVWSLG